MTQRDAEKTEDLVVVSRLGHVLRIELNRPKALNSLTLEMIHTIAAALRSAETDTDIAAVLLTGRGDRGLCAGGDIRKLYESAVTKDGQAEIFFKEEYAVNAHIARFPKPYIALMDGITMGGGIGISAHGAHRLVTERSKISMPETKIGFFPDVGTTWLLSRAPGEIGTYLGLMGVTIDAGDAIYANLADLAVPSAAINDIIAALGQLKPGCSHAQVNAILQSFAHAAPASLAQERLAIDRILNAQNLEDIMANAHAANNALGQRITTTLGERSPTALVYTFALLRAAKNSQSLTDCLEREYKAGTKLIYQHDFQEGVRAILIDKHQNPQWKPASLAASLKAFTSEML